MEEATDEAPPLPQFFSELPNRGETRMLEPDSAEPYQPDLARLRIEEGRRQWEGCGLQVVGGVAIVIGLLVTFVGLSCVFPLNLIFLLPLAFLAWVARSTLDRARRLRKSNGFLVMEADRRPPVVYLRSFADDGSYAKNAVLEGLAQLSPLSAVSRRKSYEEQIVETAEMVGPVIAIGKPGERLPELGAARVYVPHAHWKSTVKDLLGRARLVIVRSGNSQGLAWEIDTSIAQVPPERLVFYVPAAGQPPPQALKSSPATKLPQQWQRFVYFDADWTPHTSSSFSAVLRDKRLYRVPLQTIITIVLIILVIAWIIGTLVVYSKELGF